GEEGPMLRVLAERMAESSCLVTFNGKSFDWPLLRTRFVLNRVPVPAELPHLDLLHCSRRVFMHRGPGPRLVRLEEPTLDYERAQSFARAAAKGGGTVSVEALTLASRLSRRSGDAKSAVTLLEQALTSARGTQAAPLHLALSKLYEHSLKDPTRALHHARL